MRALSGKHQLPQIINNSGKSRVTPRTGCQIYKEIKNLEREVLDDLSHKKTYGKNLVVMSFQCALLVCKRGPILYIAILLGEYCYGKHVRIGLFIYNA